MKDRIRKLLLSEGFTSGAFADEIGVQRSSISHILNGRNNPSLDFVVKTKNRFPRLNLSWLIMGQGEMYLPDNEILGREIPLTSGAPTLFQTMPDDPVPEPLDIESQLTENKDTTSGNPSRQVLQVLIFYDDMSFEAYKPGNFTNNF